MVILAALTMMTTQARAQVAFKHISADQAAQMVPGSETPAIASDEKFNMSFHKRVVSGQLEKHIG